MRELVRSSSQVSLKAATSQNEVCDSQIRTSSASINTRGSFDFNFFVTLAIASLLLIYNKLFTVRAYVEKWGYYLLARIIIEVVT